MTMAIPTDRDTWAAALAPKREDDAANRERIRAEIEWDARIAVDGGDRSVAEVSDIAREVAEAIIAGEIRHLKVIY
jgi:hypothetical protein